MAIDDTGEWWVGSEPQDILAYLEAYTRSEDDGYPADAYREITCSCGCNRFRLERAAEVTRRTCAACGETGLICRAPEDWEEASAEEDVEPYACVECDCDEANVAVGFAHYEEPTIDAVKWFYVGVRCAGCGILGCFNDGKVGRGPSAEVYGSV